MKFVHSHHLNLSTIRRDLLFGVKLTEKKWTLVVFSLKVLDHKPQQFSSNRCKYEAIQARRLIMPYFKESKLPKIFTN